MSTMADKELSYTLKPPTFTGEKEDWLFFKVKMESYLAQKDMVELLSYTGAVPKDDAVPMGDTDLVELMTLIRKQNRKASGVLLSSIKTDTDRGKAAFHLVEKFIDKSDGYAAGHFIKAWKAMAKRYEDKDTVSVAELKQEYYDLKMKASEQPALLIVRWESIRNSLKDHG